MRNKNADIMMNHIDEVPGLVEQLIAEKKDITSDFVRLFQTHDIKHLPFRLRLSFQCLCCTQVCGYKNCWEQRQLGRTPPFSTIMRALMQGKVSSRRDDVNLSSRDWSYQRFRHRSTQCADNQTSQQFAPLCTQTVFWDVSVMLSSKDPQDWKQPCLPQKGIVWGYSSYCFVLQGGICYR